MTTDAERQAYLLFSEHRAEGEVAEFGAWLGASTVYLAEGVRRSNHGKVHVYDRFVWDPSHERKARAWEKEHQSGYKSGATSDKPLLQKFKDNLGSLLPYVTVHEGDIKNARWEDPNQISLMVLDAPKRVREISRVLTEFGPHLVKGAKMAWQDFAHFPSYEIVACLSPLVGRFIDLDCAIYPGTTAIFTVRKIWSAEDVSEKAFALKNWRQQDIVKTWSVYELMLPEPMRPRFACGAVMFLHDIGATKQAREMLKQLIKDHGPEILPKWRYIREHRSSLAVKYRQLLDLIPA